MKEEPLELKEFTAKKSEGKWTLEACFTGGFAGRLVEAVHEDFQKSGAANFLLFEFDLPPTEDFQRYRVVIQRVGGLDPLEKANRRIKELEGRIKELERE